MYFPTLATKQKTAEVHWHNFTHAYVCVCSYRYGPEHYKIKWNFKLRNLEKPLFI